MIVFQIAITVFVVFLIIALIVFLISKKTENRKRCKGVVISVVSMTITIFGIVLAIADDYFSQYDYSKNTIRKYEQDKKRGIPFDSLKVDISMPLEIFFVLDVSKSTNNISVKMNSEIEKKIEAINHFGRLHDIPTTFSVNEENTIPLSNLLKVRLLYSLVQLGEMNSDKIDYTIISYGSQCSKENHMSGLTLSDKIKLSFNNVMDTECDEEYTDFVKLINYTKDIVLQDFSPRNRFVRKNVCIVFLTDYLYDVSNEQMHKVQKTLEKNILELETANVGLTLFVIDDDLVLGNNASNTSNTKLIRVNSLLQNLSENTIRRIDLRSFDYNYYPSTTIPTPFPFFYSNSVYEYSIKTAITFREEQALAICLKHFTDYDKRAYRLLPSCSDKCRLLSNNETHIKVRRNERVSIEFMGYIPPPFTAPDIIIRDKETGTRYVIPIVFFKECPKSVLWLLWIIIVLLIIGMVEVAICVYSPKKTKNIVKETTEVKKEESRTLDIQFG